MFTAHQSKKNKARFLSVLVSSLAITACSGGGGGGSKGGNSTPLKEAPLSFNIAEGQEVVVDNQLVINWGAEASSADKNSLSVVLNEQDISDFFYQDGVLKNSEAPAVNIYLLQGLLEDNDQNIARASVAGSKAITVRFSADVHVPEPVVTSAKADSGCISINGSIRKGELANASITNVNESTVDLSVSGSAFSNPCYRDYVASDYDDSAVELRLDTKDKSTFTFGAGNTASADYALLGRKLESTMALQVNEGLFSVIGSWVGEAFAEVASDYTGDPLNKEVGEGSGLLLISGPGSESANVSGEVCAEVENRLLNPADGTGHTCLFYLDELDLAQNLTEASVSVNFVEQEGERFLVELNVDLGQVMADLMLRVYPRGPVSVSAEDSSKIAQAVHETFYIPNVLFGGGSETGGVVLTAKVLVARTEGAERSEIAYLALQEWLSADGQGICVPSIDMADGACVTRSFDLDAEIIGTIDIWDMADDATVFPDIATVEAGIKGIPSKPFNDEIVAQLPTLLNSVDKLVWGEITGIESNNDIDYGIGQERELMMLSGSEQLVNMRDAQGDALAEDDESDDINMLLNIEGSTVNTNAALTGGLIALAGSAQIDPSLDEALATYTKSALGSRFTSRESAIVEGLNLSVSGDAELTAVISENFLNQMLTSYYQSGVFDASIPTSFTIAELMGAGESGDLFYPGLEDGLGNVQVIIPTIYDEDTLELEAEFESLPYIRLVDGFIELHMTGLTLKGHVNKKSGNTYTYSCDKHCRGDAVLEEGMLIPDALVAKLDIVTRLQFTVDEKQLPVVKIDSENMSVQVAEFDTFLERIYNREDLDCQGNQSLVGSIACGDLEANRYTESHFMADLPALIGDDIGEATADLIQENVFGLDGQTIFESDKKLLLVMTDDFGVSANDYISLGFDVCDATEFIENGQSTSACYQKYDENVRGVYEVNICGRERTWNDLTKVCEVPTVP